MSRDRRGAAWAASLVASVLALALAAPRWVPALGGGVLVRSGSLTPVLRVRAAFFRPGRPVLAPAAGRLVAVARAGAVPAGASLAVLLPARPDGSTGSGAARGAAAPAWRRALAALWCVRAACVAVGPGTAAALPRGAPWGGGLRRKRQSPSPMPPSRAGQSRGSRPLLATAAAPGWFTPGWNALAALPAAGYAGLVPADVAPAAWPAPVPGAEVAAGTPLGVMGDGWTGVWVAVLPEPEADALCAPGVAGFPSHGGAPRAATTAWLAWPGHAAVPAFAEAAGPPVAGWRAVAFVSDRMGEGPSPPREGIFTLRLAQARGVDVPFAALRWSPSSSLSPPLLSQVRPSWGAEHAFVAVWRRGRARWVAVRLLGVSGGRAVLDGLPPAGATVLTRPGWVAPWFAGAVPLARK